MFDDDRGHIRAGIIYMQFVGRAFCGGTCFQQCHHDPAACGRKLAGIADEVDEQPFQTLLIDYDMRMMQLYGIGIEEDIFFLHLHGE